MCPPGYKGHTAEIRSARLSISIQNQYGAVYLDDVSIQRALERAARPGQSYNWFLYRSQLKASRAAKADGSCIDFVLLKTPGHSGIAYAATGRRVCESNISKCRSILRGTFDVIQRGTERASNSWLCFSREIVD